MVFCEKGYNNKDNKTHDFQKWMVLYTLLCPHNDVLFFSVLFNFGDVAADPTVKKWQAPAYHKLIETVGSHKARRGRWDNLTDV